MKYFRFSVVAIVVSAGLFSMPVMARTWEFDASQLGGGVSDADIALFNQGGQLPGTYLVDVLLNGEQVDSREVVLFSRKIPGACLFCSPA